MTPTPLQQMIGSYQAGNLGNSHRDEAVAHFCDQAHKRTANQILSLMEFHSRIWGIANRPGFSMGIMRISALIDHVKSTDADLNQVISLILNETDPIHHDPAGIDALVSILSGFVFNQQTWISGIGGCTINSDHAGFQVTDKDVFRHQLIEAFASLEDLVYAERFLRDAFAGVEQWLTMNQRRVGEYEYLLDLCAYHMPEYRYPGSDAYGKLSQYLEGLTEAYNELVGDSVEVSGDGAVMLLALVHGDATLIHYLLGPKANPINQYLDVLYSSKVAIVDPADSSAISRYQGAMTRVFMEAVVRDRWNQYIQERDLGSLVVNSIRDALMR